MIKIEINEAILKIYQDKINRNKMIEAKLFKLNKKFKENQKKEKIRINEISSDISKHLSQKKIKYKWKMNNFFNFFLLIFFPLIFTKKLSHSIFFNYISEITLTIKGTGSQYILTYVTQENYNYIDALPDQIYVNGKIQSEIGFKVNGFTKPQNIVTMKWNNPLTNCANMFRYLTNITKADLSKFDSSKVETMYCMFYGCSSLQSIDLSNLKTPLLTNIRSMFNSCRSLISLDFSSFDTSLISFTYHMCMGCSSLMYINLYSFNKTVLIWTTDMFKNVPKNLIYCINEEKASLIKNELKSLNSNNDCSNICFSKFKTVDLVKKECILNCSLSNDLHYAYNNDCFKSCPKGTYISLNNNYSCVDKCDNFINYEQTACINELPIGYYANKSNNSDINTIDKCHPVCKKCYGNGNKINHNCIECYNGYTFLNESEFRYNCYKKCDYYYYFDSSNKYNCTSEKKCPIGFTKLIPEKNKCIDSCFHDDTYRYEFGNKCYKSCPENTIISPNELYLCIETPPEWLFLKECIANYLFKKVCDICNNTNLDADKVLLKIEEEFKNGGMDSLIKKITEGEKKDFSIELDNLIYTITTPENQKNQKNKNVSTIDMEECINKLKENYNISENETLLILKIDFYEKGILIPIIEYKVYFKNETLDLNYCKDIKIKIDIPVSINEKEEFRYNSLSKFYKDICFTYTTESETDICLPDRKREFEEKNLSLCESNCDYKGYDYITKKVSCECEIKIKFPFISKIVIDKDKLLRKFSDVKNYINLNVMKCWRDLFTKKGLISNVGSYLILGIIFICIIILIIFSIKGYKQIYKKIFEIKAIIKNNKQRIKLNLISKNNKNNTKKKKQNNKIEKTIKMGRKNSHRIKNSQILKIRKNQKKSKTTKTTHILHTSANTSKSKSSNRQIKIHNNFETNISISIVNRYSKNKNQKNKYNNKLFIRYNDYEINSLDYISALKIDKRSYCQYYLSLIRIKHLLIFSFFTNNDYNSKIIKIFLFFFSFTQYLAINSLFFNDETMHEIYIKRGKFNFIYQIPIILYSTMICSFINIIVSALSLTERNILEFKRNNINIDKTFLKLIKFIKVKFKLFFILSFLLLIFFWFYVSCFCTVYVNTQLHLIKDTLISFGFTMIYPLGLLLFPGIFRIPALRSKKKNKQFLYKISQIIQII